jgi:xylitol oxidase
VIDERDSAAAAPGRNWAGNHAYRAARLHRPSSLEELQELVARTPRLRALGSRHSFNDIADAEELVSLDRLELDLVVDRAAGTVSLGGAVRYGDLARALRRDGLALAAMASLPHISVAGAVSTATHGSGDRVGNLATAVAELALVTSNGELVRVARGDPAFEGMVIGLGALGVVVRVTLDVEPAYEVRQRVYEGLGWDVLAARFDAITASGYSVSAFTGWADAVDQVWVKSRAGGASPANSAELFGARAADAQRHPILGLDPANCTPQLGVPGAWADRLPHFRMGFTPSAGDELQSEYLVPRPAALEAIQALRRMSARLRPLVQVTEIRTVAADALWMSPQYGTDTVGIHFTWVPDEAAVRDALVYVERALEPFDARPHWAKVFLADADAIRARYDRLPDFARLVERLDPRGTFRNRWLERHVLGSG